jgi:hypothetical protein
VLVIITRHIAENRISLRANAARFALHASLALVALGVPVMGFYDRGLEGIYGLQQGAGGLRIVRIAYVVSGAGMGDIGSRNFYFDPRWDDNSLR